MRRDDHRDPAPEQQSGTPLPIRYAYSSPTPSDRAHDSKSYTGTSRSAHSPEYSPLRRDALESQALAFARSQRGREDTLIHSASAKIKDCDAMDSQRARGHAPTEHSRGRNSSRHIPHFHDHDHYQDPCQKNDDREHGIGDKPSHRETAHLHDAHVAVAHQGSPYVPAEPESRLISVCTPVNNSSTRQSRSPLLGRTNGRSRSPARTSRPPIKRTRSATRHQHNGCPEHDAGDRPGMHSAEGDHDEVPGMSGALIPVKKLYGPGTAANFRTELPLAEIQRRKNMHSVCIPCWDKGLSCDGGSRCGECRARRKTCAYVVCPVHICHLDVKCPAIHILSGLSLDNYSIGTAMHLLALLGLDRPFLQSYDIRGIQEIHNKARSAQSVYLLLQEEIKKATQQKKKKLHQHAIRRLLIDSEKVPDMGKKALSTITSMIVKLVEQQT